MSTAKTHEFILHVIPPPMRLDWTTPRSLFVATFLNHLRGDKAPIGHLYVEFTLPTDAQKSLHPKVAGAVEGGQRVITGMSRRKMTTIESLKVVQGKSLGLGTFFYDFNGKLDSVEEAREEIAWAKKRNRYATIHVSISEEKSQLMFEFLKEWIEKGSFRHYSGGLRVDCGEGAGCAEFGMHFLGMALGLHAVNPEWTRRVRVPNELIGGGFAGHAGRISVFDIFKDGDRWAYGSEPHMVYSIPDPELIFDWIKARVDGVPFAGAAGAGAQKRQKRKIDSDGRNEISIDLIPQDVSWNSGEFVRREFKVNYPAESLGAVQEQWTRVVEK